MRFGVCAGHDGFVTMSQSAALKHQHPTASLLPLGTCDRCDALHSTARHSGIDTLILREAGRTCLIPACGCTGARTARYQTGRKPR